MSNSTLLYSILSANSALNTAVGGRIYPNIIPQAQGNLPVVVYRTVSKTPTNDNDGVSKMDFPSFDIWCYGATKLSAENTAELLRTALDGYNSSGDNVNWVWFISESDDYLEEKECFVVRHEYTFSNNT